MKRETRRMKTALVVTLLALAALAGSASAASVTIELVTPVDGKMVSIRSRQSLWKSPFGGWGIASWPFTMKVDDTPILDYRSGEQNLMAKAMGGGGTASSVNAADTQLDKTFALEEGVGAEDLAIYNFNRSASATLSLASGRHVIQPFGLEFTTAADGSPATSDPRLRVDARTRRIEVVCYPVTVKTIEGDHSVSGSLQLSCGTSSLLGGLENVFADYDKMNLAEGGASLKAGFRRFTLYLPASVAGNGYEVNGVKFDLDADGRVKLAAEAAGKALCKDGSGIVLIRPVTAASATGTAATVPLGVTWFGTPGEVKIACGAASVIGNQGLKISESRVKTEGGKTETVKGGVVSVGERVGSAWLPVPASGAVQVQLGGLSVRLPASDGQWPHRHLVWDVPGSACWAVETMPLVEKPGAAWSCRITPLAGKVALPAALKVQLEPVSGGAVGGVMELTGAAGLFTGTLPSAPGLWRLRVVGDGGGLLKGLTLGMAMMGDKASSGVSLFTFKNRALFRRGDTFDLLWLARRDVKASAAVEWPVRLRGVGLDAPIGKIVVPSDRRDAAAVNGRLVVDTSALAPGEYTAVVEADGVAGYPFTFRICQREPLSDFELYAFRPVMAAARIYPGSPVTSYVNHMPEGPGLGPYMGDGDGSLDGALAAYANAPFGPAAESFAKPAVEDRQFMAIAAMGMRAAPAYPTMLSCEDQNPKHTLPENLAELRRRMALYMQAHADIPGLDGFGLGWYATRYGFYESSQPVDADCGRRGAASDKWAGARLGKALEKYDQTKLTAPQKKGQSDWVGTREWSQILPWSFEQWMLDASQMRPGLTLYNHKPSFWIGEGSDRYSPTAWIGMSHRSAIDYTDYCIPPWGNFRIPALLGMGNQAKQKITGAYWTHSWRSEMIATSFGAVGRGLDGIAMTYDESRLSESLLRIFERFGSMFTALDPLPDVAVYWTSWANRTSVILHDLARMRRPGMVVSPEDVLAGELSKYKVLFLAGVGDEQWPEIREAFRAFEACGGVIIKDDACSADMPGRKLGYKYDNSNVHGGWGLGGPNGEWEFASLLDGYKKIREKFLVEAFAKAPPIPVTTPDTDIIISPLAGKDSIVCFVINKTEVPLEIAGRWRQSNVLPKIGELQVEKGWYIHDLLTGKPAKVESTSKGQRVVLDFTGAEGAIYLLTQREPKAAAIQTVRTTPNTLRLTGWLADAGDKPLADPMPFEVTLKGPDGKTLFHKFAALGPDVALDVPVPAMAADAKLELVARDLVLGTTVSRPVTPAAPGTVATRSTPDWVGGEKPILSFLAQRKGPVTVMLDEGQEAFRPAAEQMAALLKKSGREARVVAADLADVRPLTLRWNLLKDDRDVLASVTNQLAFAWRIGMSQWFPKDVRDGFKDPRVGYDEMGPRLRHDADIVLFGAPGNNRVLSELRPYLRRVTSDTYPAPGGFFVHYLYSPLQGGYDGLYVGCQDAAGAGAAVATLATVTMPAPPATVEMEGKPVVSRGGAAAPLENMATGLGGTPVIGLAFSPSGNRVFATTAAYGEWFFVLSSTGDILEKQLPPVTKKFPNWWLWRRSGLKPVTETSLRIGMWDAQYLYDVKKGFVSKAAELPQHFLPGPHDGGGPSVRTSTQLDDEANKRVYLGGNDRIHAMTPDGRELWRFEDSAVSPDLHYPRGLFPRAVSGDGRVLIVGAFGVHDLMFGTSMRSPSVMGLDTATGKLLWQRAGMVLNEGKVVPLDDRFIVIDDDGNSSEIMAADGKTGAALNALSGSADWVLQLPGRDAMLMVENDHFDRQGRTARVYIRPNKGGEDRDLKVPGRVLAVALTPDKQSFIVVTTPGKTLRFATDGALLWTADVSCADRVCLSPDGRTMVMGGYDGVVSFLNVADGKILRRADLNSANIITPEKFATQERIGELPQDAGMAPPSPSPVPSYLTSLDPKKVSFGPNLVPAAVIRAKLKPADAAATDPAKPGYLGKLTEPVTLTFKVEAGTTYLVELLDAVANPAEYKPTLRLEVAVKSTDPQSQQKNLPYTVNLPLGPALARYRAAFRADAAGEVMMTLRTVLPQTQGEGKKARTTFDKPGETPVLLGDVVVAALRFPGRNLLFDGGPSARSKPAGTLTCTGYPHQDGSNTEKVPFTRRDAALRLVNGLLANQETAWAGGVDAADIVVSFTKPQSLSALVIYEDASGPISGGDRVRELATPRYSVDAITAKGASIRLGLLHDNTQLINIFPCPTDAITGIRYTWASRFDGVFKGLSDGTVRMAQMEAYEVGGILDTEDLLNVKDDGLKIDL